MNKNIRRLIESLFDDDILDDISKPDNSDMIFDKISSTDIVKPLLDKIVDRSENNDLAIFFNAYKTLPQLSEISKSYKNGINIGYVRISLYKGNVKYFKELFDILLDYDIHFSINVLEFSLENKTDKVYSIKDLFDFEKYKSILKIKDFVVSYGRLKDFKGFPSYIENEIYLNWIKEVNSLEGFPITKNNLSLYFNNSVLPDDWTGCPHKLQELNFQPELPSMLFNVEDEVNSIVNSMGNLKNIPYDLTFERDNMSRGCNLYIGCMLVDPSWKTEVKKEIRKYIGNCLKTQYKNITNLKKKIMLQY